MRLISLAFVLGSSWADTYMGGNGVSMILHYEKYNVSES